MTKKQFYIASRTANKDQYNKLAGLLEAKGYLNTINWISQPNIKPYNTHRKVAEKYSILSTNAIKNCDLFILLSDEAGSGMYVELGMAILLNIINRKPQIFVINQFNENHIFYFHPAVKRIESIEKLLNSIR